MPWRRHVIRLDQVIEVSRCVLVILAPFFIFAEAPAILLPQQPQCYRATEAKDVFALRNVHLNPSGWTNGVNELIDVDKVCRSHWISNADYVLHAHVRASQFVVMMLSCGVVYQCRIHKSTSPRCEMIRWTYAVNKSTMHNSNCKNTQNGMVV